MKLTTPIPEIILTKFPSWSSTEFEKIAGNWFRLGKQPGQQKKSWRVVY